MGEANATRTVVVVGGAQLAATTAAMLAGASVRREGYALLAEHAAPPAGGPAPVHRLARGTRHLDIAVATRPLDWPGAVEHTDQVVVATTTGDVATAVSHLQAMHARGGRAAALASSAVVVLSRAHAAQPAPSEVTGRFAELARATLTVPHQDGAPVAPLRQSALPPPTREAWDRVEQVVGADDLSPDEMDTQPRIDVRDLFAGGAPAASAGPWRDDPRPSGRRRWWLAGVAAVAVVALVVTPFVIGGGLPWGGDPADEAVRISPVAPVHGWTSQAEWVSSPIAVEGRAPTVLLREGAVITTTGDVAQPDITALSGADGSQLWSSRVDGPLTGPPQLITWEDRPAVIAATSNELYLWPHLGSGGTAPTVQTWTFTEADVRLVEGSPVPLLANEETLTALVLHDGALRRRTLPSGGSPVGADDEGRVLSVGTTGHWWQSGDGGEVSTGTLLAPPAYGSLPGSVLGVAGTHLVVNWTRNNRTTHLVGYDVTDLMAESWTTTVPGRVGADDFAASPDGSWAVAGSVAVDLGTGTTEPLASGWETLRVIDDRAWSPRHTTTKGGVVTPLPEAVPDPDGVPVGVTGSGLGLVVAADEDGRSRIYALRPDPDA
ncbi:hypothetical protein B277_01040 [Janibacter hoylei PVAS-1]|uniref:Uncharacterized protein n=1 Tax=Janibacter hoylei PVAS-1 TaxID=1210046 RepID=K1E2B2_9MICO|nr:hypothetical protein [Janibacter hoylei]EKA62759.1 hypothetical protein B277_01040 [Janibacter hoylei PVAS-1]RWU84833.1 hypothetical protein CWN80_04525 [Janibacter hoylei PVAS-1]